MGNELKVLATDLTDRAGKHRDVAAHIEDAEKITDGATLTVGRTHGVACSLTIAALGEAQTSRSAAAQAMNKVSSRLAEKLDTSAANYTQSDHQGQDNLDRQMPPR